MGTTNMQILEAILNRTLQSEQEEEINELEPLNSYHKGQERLFILDSDEFPEMIGYLNPRELSEKEIQETLQDCHLRVELLGIKIYELN